MSRGISPAARAYQARMRALRRSRRSEIEAGGGDWKKAHWANGTMPTYTGGPDYDTVPVPDGDTIVPLDFADRSVVDWSDLDAAEEFN